jgi:hypothetical protein
VPTSEVAEDDPLALFAELMPVFSSPRCTNCHGGTNPQTNLNHVGGQVDVQMDSIGNMNRDTNGACLECHTAPAAKSGDWHLAPVPKAFVNKDTLAMCRQLRFFNTLNDPARRAVFIEHLHNDPLIGLAFVGRGGIDDNSPFADEVSADPPPMTYREFLAAAQRWVDDGEAACSNKWNGTITETTTSSERASFAPAPGGREVGLETKVLITVVENKATAAVHWTLHDFTDVPIRECAVHVRHSFSADGDRLPVDLTIATKVDPVPTGGFSFPGFPPGMELPPGMVPPSSPGPFIGYAPTESSELVGNHHTDIRSMPGCQQAVSDEQHKYQLTGAMIEVTIDPDDPNHLSGEKVVDSTHGKTTITWDLTRDVE